VFLVWAAGPVYLLATFAVYAPASIVHLLVRRPQGGLTAGERIGAVVVAALGVAAVVLLATGTLAL
jgi:arginine:ornithine antiporter/lysine permease